MCRPSNASSRDEWLGLNRLREHGGSGIFHPSQTYGGV
jgi:hypothetical protein